MNPLSTTELEAMLQAGESATLDYKSQQYKFNGATDEEKAALLKDVLAMANAWKTVNAHILLGVKENPGGRADVVGVSEHVDDSRLQQFVNGKTNVPVRFAYHVVSVDGQVVGVITVSATQPRPVWLKKAFGGLAQEAVYIRRGSSTATATPDEIADIGEARRETQEEIHALLKDQSAHDEEQRRVDHFMSFLHNERYHDLRFPQLKSERFPMGLVYTAYPERDENGQPRVRKTEMTKMYIVRIEQRAFSHLTPEEAMEYDRAPVHTHELYFCRFYNGSWHLGQDSVGSDWHQVYMSGKLGECEWGITANAFQGLNVPPEGVKWSKECVIGRDGRPSDSGSLATVYVTDSGVQVQPSHDAPAKEVRYQHNIQTGARVLVIDNLEGYFTGEARAPFCKWVVATVEEAGHEIPVVKVFE